VHLMPLIKYTLVLVVVVFQLALLLMDLVLATEEVFEALVLELDFLIIMFAKDYHAFAQVEQCVVHLGLLLLADFFL
jgi:hypothetical protein